MKDPAAPDAPARKPFAAVVQEQRKGGLHSELTDLLAELVQAVASTGKVGSLTLQLKVKPIGEGTVSVTDVVKTTVPQPEKGAAIFYYDEDGNLSRNNPAQLTIDKPVRDAAQAAV